MTDWRVSALSERSGAFALPPFTLRSALNGAIHVRERLTHAGIGLPPRHRLERAEQTIRAMLALAAADGHARPRVSRTQFAEMLRTILEQFFIVRALAADQSVVTPDLRKRLKAILGGADAPGDDRRTAARDAQFELAAAALLRLGGVRGVHWAEPDLRIPAGDEDLCLAVKRISSPKQFERRVREAIRQIRRQDGMGLIVLGLDAFGGDAVRDTGHGSQHATRRARMLVRSTGTEDVVAGVLGLSTTVVWRDPDDVVLLGLEVEAHLELITPQTETGPAQIAGLQRRIDLIGRNIVGALSREALWLEG